MIPIDEIIPRCEPHVGEEPDWSRAFYPNPPSHDFCTFLVIAELMRREHGAKVPLQVSLMFHDGMLGKYDFMRLGILGGKCCAPNLPLSYSNQMVAHVLRPAIGMIGAVAGPDLHTPVNADEIKHHCEYSYFPSALVDAARAGYEIPRWQEPAGWAMREVDAFLQGEAPVVITLRETPLQRERNSRTQEWINFAESIDGSYPVLFVRDTWMANFPLGEWRTWPLASTDVHIRHALYRRAFCNLMVSTGSVAWCQYGAAPYLFFKQLVPVLDEWPGGNAEGWREQAHMEVGDQWPWAGPHQRLTWKDDTEDNICEEFEAHVGRHQHIYRSERAAVLRQLHGGDGVGAMG